MNRTKYMKRYYQKNKEKINKQHKKWRKNNKEKIKEYLKNNRWYKHYSQARQRCNNPKNPSFKNYGGRGIKFLMIKEDFKYLWFRDKGYNLKRPSIDRKNNNGDYTINNCQFIEFSENSRKNMIGKRYNTKLIAKQVKQIRNLYAKGNITQKKLGKKFKVCRETIKSIVKYTNWKHI